MKLRCKRYLIVRGSLGCLGLAGLLALTGSNAHAVTFTGTASPVEGNIDFSAAIARAISLDIVGDIDGADTTTLTDAGLGSAGINDVDFGSVDVQCSTGPGTGACAVVDATQANLVATLTATVQFSGFSTAGIYIYRPTPVTGFAAGRMRFLSGIDGDWTLAGTGALIGEGQAAQNQLLAPTAVSGSSVTHQVAARVLATDGAATYTSPVTYRVEAN